MPAIRRAADRSCISGGCRATERRRWCRARCRSGCGYRRSGRVGGRRGGCRDRRSHWVGGGECHRREQRRHCGGPACRKPTMYTTRSACIRRATMSNHRPVRTLIPLMSIPLRTTPIRISTPMAMGLHSSARVSLWASSEAGMAVAGMAEAGTAGAGELWLASFAV
jgi:hypothetical protein